MKKILKKIIPESMKRNILSAKDSIDFKLCVQSSKSGILSSLYYLLFSRKFRREHQSVLVGRVKYNGSLAIPDKSSALLRRNTHRLEKGLIMRPRRDVFAEAYIEETVDHYLVCQTVNSTDHNEMCWAKDVLSEYFSTVNVLKSEIINKSYIKFSNGLSADKDVAPENIPYQRSSVKLSDISLDNLKELCIQRRSVRWFKDQLVEKEKITAAIEIASLAPSACNRQPFEFYVTTSPEEAREVGAIPMGTVGFSNNLQALIVVVGNLSAYPFEQDRHVIYIDASLASMQLMLALETQGLSSCPINWPDIENLEKKMAKRLGITIDQRPVMLIAVGYASEDGLIPYSQKKSPSVLMKSF
ncbi:nitroreductase family protein [Serratia proteamaculans]